MVGEELSPRQALNNGYLKQKQKRAEFDRFTSAVTKLLSEVNAQESEEFNKNLISDFLKKAYYSPAHYINTKDRSDLVIHNGRTAQTAVGVIFEVKSPANRAEMPNRKNLNTKAVQELLLYFLRERSVAKNVELRTLVVTNAYEWYIFDANEFERLFFDDKRLVRHFEEFQAQALVGKTTEFFYKHIAAPAIDAVQEQLKFTCLDLRDYSADLSSLTRAAEKRLIPIAKCFSPEHLLKVPFATDAQSLDPRFYSELLHIIGLAERKVKSKKLIQRNQQGERNAGSLLENAIAHMESLDCMSSIPKPGRFGSTPQERIFAVGLELVITWIDRVIFLKLLEAQLIRYHRGDKSWAFLNSKVIASFDDLNDLFFSVLARRPKDRDPALAGRFGRVPYLNSSLFDPAEIERQALFISNLHDGLTIPIWRHTVLQDQRGRKLSGELPTLQYLLDFLDAYDFSGEGGEEIQEENKALISPAVLGLIFEKINGYKDGSFFTPGVVTMHMARESVTRVVIDKFNSAYGWTCCNLSDVFNQIENREAASDLIDSVTICDPAVGSGHFLVSALNEILAIKSNLRVLFDRQGRSLRDYSVDVINDELVVTGEGGEFFSYNPQSKDSQTVQEALFQQKQTIIENCLFGVDINPNSVKICRLRLWIELLKCAYYRVDEEGARVLETLPNIDVNIKAGNSLIFQFGLTTPLGSVLRKAKRSIADYRRAISQYQAARGRQEKKQLEVLIEQIRADFRASAAQSLVTDLESELRRHEDQQSLFEEEGSKRAHTWRLKKALKEKIDVEKERMESAAILRSVFEWRYEFPQVLDGQGGFVGFDLIIANPPYGVSIARDERSYIEGQLGRAPDHEIYYMFVNLAGLLLRDGGVLAFIVPNTLLVNVNAATYRQRILDSWCVSEIADCSEFSVFQDAVVRNVILILRKNVSCDSVGFRRTGQAVSIKELLSRPIEWDPKQILVENIRNWAIVFRVKRNVLELASRIRRESMQLAELFPEISQGLIAYDRYQGQDQALIKSRALHSRSVRDSDDRPWLRGEDVRRYQVNWNGEEYVAYGQNGGKIANPRKPKFFRQRRILVREITSPFIYAAVTDEELYNDPAIINILEPKKPSMPLFCLLGILNSRLATFYHLHSSPKIAKGLFPKILVADLREFPLPKTHESVLAGHISACAEELQNVSRLPGGRSTASLERDIDASVYRLYELKDCDIELIEARLDEVLSGHLE